MKIKFWIKNLIPVLLSVLSFVYYSNAVKVFRIMRTMIGLNVSPDRPDPFASNKELHILVNSTSIIFTVLACVVVILLFMSITDILKRIIGKDKINI